MEIAEIVSHYVDKTQNLIIVEFRLFDDEIDVVREDFIEYSFFEEFGFEQDNFDNNLLENYEEDEWGDDDFDYINDEDTLISFLNEYYVVYPKKLPKPQIK
jgi:hypothetical protein